MAKYKNGDMIVVHIRDVEQTHPSGIPFYEIDPAEDGTQRFLSESVIDKMIDMGGDLYSHKTKRLQNEKSQLSMSNRDRVYSIIKSFFSDSKYYLRIPEKGKYKDKIIEIVEKSTNACNYQLWCHVRNDRIDIVSTDSGIKSKKLKNMLEKNSNEIDRNGTFSRQSATSYRYINEEALTDICKLIVD